MAKRGKKYTAALEKLIDTIFMNRKRRWLLSKGTRQNSMRLWNYLYTSGFDPRHADQQVGNNVVLPHGTGKSRTVLVFRKRKAQEATDAQADYVGARVG